MVSSGAARCILSRMTSVICMRFHSAGLCASARSLPIYPDVLKVVAVVSVSRRVARSSRYLSIVCVYPKTKRDRKRNAGL